MDLLATIGHRITQGPTLGYAILILALILAPRIAEAIAAHETTFHKREEVVAGPVVVGRSLKPHPA